MRDSARTALLGAGGRGFVRFCEQGALLVSDAIRRCEDDAARQKLTDALAQAGFESWTQDDLLMIVPSDVLLEQIACSSCEVDWTSQLHGAQALAARWLARERQALTKAGRQLIVDCLRLTWQDRVVDGLRQLRAQAAVMQRSGDTSGFCQAGAVLADWCRKQEGKAR
jgi:hypothetical protein